MTSRESSTGTLLKQQLAQAQKSAEEADRMYQNMQYTKAEKCHVQAAESYNLILEGGSDVNRASSTFSSPEVNVKAEEMAWRDSIKLLHQHHIKAARECQSKASSVKRQSTPGRTDSTFGVSRDLAARSGEIINSRIESGPKADLNMAQSFPADSVPLVPTRESLMLTESYYHIQATPEYPPPPKPSPYSSISSPPSHPLESLWGVVEGWIAGFTRSPSRSVGRPSNGVSLLSSNATSTPHPLPNATSQNEEEMTLNMGKDGDRCAARSITILPDNLDYKKPSSDQGWRQERRTLESKIHSLESRLVSLGQESEQRQHALISLQKRWEEVMKLAHQATDLGALQAALFALNEEHSTSPHFVGLVNRSEEEEVSNDLLYSLYLSTNTSPV